MIVSSPTLKAGPQPKEEESTGGKSGISAAVGKDQFMRLLVSQLQQQDPLDPVKDREFVSQLTELSTLESIETLNTTFEQMMQIQQLSQGAGLIGKTVSFRLDKDSPVETATVQGLETQDKKVQLVTTEGKKVPLDGILGVTGAV